MDDQNDYEQTEVLCLARAARGASAALGQTSGKLRNEALVAMAQQLREHSGAIVRANDDDMRAARALQTKESLLDRLMLNPSRIDQMACALEDLSSLADPLGQIQEKRTLESGIVLRRISVPLGVVAVIYEARPNVTADAAGICLKAGNAALLRGGSLAAHSNALIAALLHDAAVHVGLPAGCIGYISSGAHEATDELMTLHTLIDVLIPRGGAGLIRHCIDHARIPVIETGTGNCHLYVHKTADISMAIDILINAKCRRFGVCNAVETLLIDQTLAERIVPEVLAALSEHGVSVHGDELTQTLACTTGFDVRAATRSDWEREYLSPDIAIKCVADVGGAIEHINTFGTRHSEAIVANSDDSEGAGAIDQFLQQVDAAALYVNASTAFTDGGAFGLGAEIGISTQKLHVRGPFALEGLTSYKYLLQGTGQVRS